MPHYKDGTQAKVGDIVKGKGYNIKDERGELAEVTGIVTHLNENATACNITLFVPLSDGDHPIRGNFQLPISDSFGWTSGALVEGKTEYGQTDHFEKV